jgi:hypothetical protein
MSLCWGGDAYTRDLEIDHATALWRVELSDGRVVVQDDHRPGAEPASAWQRLGLYLLAHPDLAIRRFWLQFRSNVHADILPRDAEGYYFCKSALANIASNRTTHFYLIGALTGCTIMVQRWSVPDLTLVDTEAREPKPGPCLLVNPRRRDELARGETDTGLPAGVRPAL